jgi:guanyl-specific ribonuclease Sa
MRKIKLPLLLSAFFLYGLAPAFAAGPAIDAGSPVYALLSDLAAVQPPQLAVSTPTALEEAVRFDKPACVPSQALLPGKTFAPVVSDARRMQAIDDLLAKIAVCKPMPYDNDGVVHTDPHPGLPRKPAGYYKEYTLIVPGRNTGAGPEAVQVGGTTYMTGPVLSPRGPERLMIGNSREVYYTPDHYTTFILLSIVR